MAWLLLRMLMGCALSVKALFLKAWLLLRMLMGCALSVKALFFEGVVEDVDGGAEVAHRVDLAVAVAGSLPFPACTVPFPTAAVPATLTPSCLPGPGGPLLPRRHP